MLAGGIPILEYRRLTDGGEGCERGETWERFGEESS